MRANGEAMRLIAQPLQKKQHRIARLQTVHRLARPVKLFAPGIAIRALGNRHQRYGGNVQFPEHFHGDRKLPRAAIDQQQIRPRAGAKPLGEAWDAILFAQ